LVSGECGRGVEWKRDFAQRCAETQRARRRQQRGAVGLGRPTLHGAEKIKNQAPEKVCQPRRLRLQKMK
jgi:ribosomal protein L44E